jgi:hypothetical protein
VPFEDELLPVEKANIFASKEAHFCFENLWWKTRVIIAIGLMT